MSKFSKGDKARVTSVDIGDIEVGIKVGDIVTVDEDGSHMPYCVTLDGKVVVLSQGQLERYIETTKEITLNGATYVLKEEPKPEHEWKFGDIAVHDEYGVGIVFGVEGGDTIVFKEKETLIMKCVSPRKLTFLRRTDFSV